MAALRDVRVAAAGSTPTRPTVATTPNRSPATTAVRGSGWRIDGPAAAAPTTTTLAARPGTARRRRASSRSRGSAVSTSPVTPADEVAVARLRSRKHRPGKPFAVMAARPATPCAPSPASRRPRRPALSQPARPDRAARTARLGPLAGGVAPGLDEIGVMLPYTPLHHLLLDPVDGRPPPVLVMTSGNLADEPLCYRNDDARDAAARHRRRVPHARPRHRRALRRLGGRGLGRRRAAGAPVARLRPAPGVAGQPVDR